MHTLKASGRFFWNLRGLVGLCKSSLLPRLRPGECGLIGSNCSNSLLGRPLDKKKNPPARIAACGSFLFQKMSSGIMLAPKPALIKTSGFFLFPPPLKENLPLRLAWARLGKQHYGRQQWLIRPKHTARERLGSALTGRLGPLSPMFWLKTTCQKSQFFSKKISIWNFIFFFFFSFYFFIFYFFFPS